MDAPAPSKISGVGGVEMHINPKSTEPMILNPEILDTKPGRYR